MTTLLFWSATDDLYYDYCDQDEFFVIPESRLPLPTSSLIRTSRYSRHFDKDHLKWSHNKGASSSSNSNSTERRSRTRSIEKKVDPSTAGRSNTPKKFSLCMSGIESSDESGSSRIEKARMSLEKSGKSFCLVNNLNSGETKRPSSPIEGESHLQQQLLQQERIDFMRRAGQENKHTTGALKSSLPVRCSQQTVSTKQGDPRQVKAPVTEKEVRNRKDFTNLDNFCENRNAIFDFEEVLHQARGSFQRKSSQSFGEGQVSVLIHRASFDDPTTHRTSFDDRSTNKQRRRRKKKVDIYKNAQHTTESSNSSMSSGSKRSSVISDSNDSNVETSSLGILSPTEMQSNGSISASATSCGSSFPASWITNVKRMVVSSSKQNSSKAITSNDLSVEDLDGEDTLAEESSSTTSNTLSSNPSTSSSSYLPRKTSFTKTSSVDQNVSTRKLSMGSLVPRPTRGAEIERENMTSSPTKFHRFQLDTATVREIESLDKSYENVSSVMASTKIPIFTNQIKSPTFEQKFPNFTNPTSVKSPTFERKYSYFDGPTVKSPTNENSAKFLSRLPKLQSKPKCETYPDVSDIFLARTEELLKSSRSKSGKKRRHTTADEPKFEAENEKSSLDALSKRHNNYHMPLRRSESPPSGISFEHFHSNPRTFILNEVDAGIGNSMPSSLISNNSMGTSQDIGMSQYEMESSGVFSDGDPGRKSSLFIESKMFPEHRLSLEPNEHSILSTTLLLELREESDLKVLSTKTLPELAEELDLKNDCEIENQENQVPALDNVQSEEENDCGDEEVVVEDLTPKIEIQSCQSTPKLPRKESSSLNRDVTSRPGSRNLKPEAVIVKRPRSRETKGLATKRSELLQEKPIIPNTNVGSKLKGVLSRQPTQSEPRKQQRPGKWDAIMNSIAEGRKKDEGGGGDLADRVKEVKSKVFADFRPPVLGKPPRMVTPDRIEVFSRSNSTVSNASAIHVPSRSNSTVSNVSNINLPLSDVTKTLTSRSNSTMSSAATRRGSSSVLGTRSNSHLSGESVHSRPPKFPGTRSNSISSTVSSGKGSEITLKGPKNSSNSLKPSSESITSRQKSGLSFGPRTSTTSKDGSRGPTPAPGITTAKATRKSSAPAATTTRKTSVNAKVVPSNVKLGANGKITSSTNSITSAGSGTTTTAKNYNQPDVVKVSSPAPHPDLHRENLQLRERLGHSAKGFTAMAVALGHVSKEMSAFDTPKLRHEIKKLRQHIQEQNIQIARLNESYSAELSKYKTSFTEAQLNTKLEEMQEQQQAFHDKLLIDHHAEIERIKEAHRLSLIELGAEQEEMIRQLEARHLVQLEESENRWRSKLAQKFEYKTDELIKQESDFERREEHWIELRRALEDQIHSLKSELKQREEESITKHKGDSLQRSNSNKYSKVTAEIESLTAVLEMKSEELRGLRADKIRLEEKLSDFDQMKTSLQKASALAEDLKAQIDAKNNLERKLSRENRLLHESMERELHERKKLSQENEELHWKMRQSFCATSLDGAALSASMIDYTSTLNPMFASLQQDSLSASYTAESGCPQSLPTFTGRNFVRSYGHRPVSAPPGKFDFLSKLCTSTPNPSTGLEPDSPRVLEVVEKTESVSWKIEYNEGEADMCASPNLKRKLSPHSPMTIRKSTRNGKPHPAGDVMTRSMMDSSRSSPCPSNDVLMARSCISLSRSNSSSSRKKMGPPFETLNENANETETKVKNTKEVGNSQQQQSFASEQMCFKTRNGSERSRDSSNLSSISDEDDIGDISSSSEIEINEPAMDVTTPQIEEMQFLFPGGANQDNKHPSEASSPDAELTLRDELSSSTFSSNAMSHNNAMSSSVKKLKSRSDNVMSKSVQGSCPSVTSVMSNSLPSYDLHKLFKGPEILQDSGGESLMARFEEEDPSFALSGMTDSTSTESDEPEIRIHQLTHPPMQQQLIHPVGVKHQKNSPSMAESLTGVTWSEDFDQLP